LNCWEYGAIDVMGFLMALVILKVSNYELNFGENQDGTSRASSRGLGAMILIAAGLAGAQLLATLVLDSIFSRLGREESGAEAVAVWGAQLCGYRSHVRF
jgi:hypothetical protein